MDDKEKQQQQQDERALFEFLNNVLFALFVLGIICFAYWGISR